MRSCVCGSSKYRNLKRSDLSAAGQSECHIDVNPFLKWPGGKCWFISNYAALFPVKFKRYIEPFLGAGSVFFHLKPKNALLGDVNRDLVTTYQAIKKDWKRLVSMLQKHECNHSDEYYYKIRDQEPKALIECAARMIYLNRTCFNGIYRVNCAGKFNVPKGDRDSVFLEDDNFEAVAKLLVGAEIHACDFEILINRAKRNDFVFADPPYTVRHNQNGFIQYNEKLFSWADQIRLANALFRAQSRGAQVVSTNANHNAIRKLYRGFGFSLFKVSRFSPISAEGKSRKEYEEIIVLSGKT